MSEPLAVRAQALRALRAAHRRLIEQDGVTITVTRRERLPDARSGGLTEVTSTKGPYRVRVHRLREALPREVSTLEGTKQVQVVYRLQADDTVDLRAGAQVEDTFDAAGFGRFRVLAVYALRYDGEVYGYEADLELVS